MTKNKILVSIVTLNYNGKRIMGDLLKSIEKIDFPKNELEILIVDNGSSDGSQEFFRKNYPNIKLIENKRNLGFAGGMNVGVKHSKGKYVAILSNDLIVHKDWLKELVKVIKSSEKIAIVDPIIYEIGNKNIKKTRSKFVGSGTNTLMQFAVKLKDIDQNYKTPFYIFSPSGSCLFNKEILGIPFDPDYFIYAEDTYIGWLARLKGYSVVKVPTSILYHRGGITVNNMNMKSYFLYLCERNRFINMLIFYDIKTLIKLVPLLIGLILFINLHDCKKINTRLKTYCWLLKNWRLIRNKRKKIQNQRKAPDKEIIKFMSYKILDEKKINNTFMKAVIMLFNNISYIYCWAVGIRTIEFYNKSIETL